MPEKPEINREGLIYDWNRVGGDFVPLQPIQLDDETLRDGIQCPSVTDPPIEEKSDLLTPDGPPGHRYRRRGLARRRGSAVEDVTALGALIRDNKLRIRPNCAARTMIGTSSRSPRFRRRSASRSRCARSSAPPRSASTPRTGRWRRCCKHTRESLSFAVKEGLPVMYVTEDTTRADPETLRALYSAAIECGAKRVCICDTVGHATAEGWRAWSGSCADSWTQTGARSGVDWHGHRDRGLAVVNSLAAIEAGATGSTAAAWASASAPATRRWICCWSI